MGRGTGQKGHGLAVRVLVRVLVGCALVVFLLVAALGVWSAVRGIFLVRNPHFTLKHIDVTVNGQLRTAEVIRRLDELGAKVERTNLFALDLPRLRQALCTTVVVISHAELRLKLPSTLAVDVTERVPVVQLRERGGRLVDADGLVLPARPDGAAPPGLPVILGLRSNPALTAGKKATDELLLSSLALLRLISIRPYGRLLDIEAIQLDYARNALGVHLRSRGTFREGAQVLLPAKSLDLEDALQRVEIIARERMRGQQSTGFIDATYHFNVPVLP